LFWESEGPPPLTLPVVLSTDVIDRNEGEKKDEDSRNRTWMQRERK
jgi:hypothetical protein